MTNRKDEAKRNRHLYFISTFTYPRKPRITLPGKSRDCNIALSTTPVLVYLRPGFSPQRSLITTLRLHATEPSPLPPPLEVRHASRHHKHRIYLPLPHFHFHLPFTTPRNISSLAWSPVSRSCVYGRPVTLAKFRIRSFTTSQY
jgi:hypothetical protein